MSGVGDMSCIVVHRAVTEVDASKEVLWKETAAAEVLHACHGQDKQEIGERVWEEEEAIWITSSTRLQAGAPPSFTHTLQPCGVLSRPLGRVAVSPEWMSSSTTCEGGGG